MSGDVFGNGVLLSRVLKLVAAFDHRHIFIDPDPDPEASFRERERMFALPRSSWRDYDVKLLSAGGGVYDRSAKAIPLSARGAQAARGRRRGALGRGGDPQDPDRARGPALQRRHRHLREGRVGGARRGRRPRQRPRARERQRAARAGAGRGRQPRPHAEGPARVLGGRGPAQHRRRRQLGRRRHLRPRGEHQDPARHAGQARPGQGPRRAQPDPGRDDRRRRGSWCSRTTRARRWR